MANYSAAGFGFVPADDFCDGLGGVRVVLFFAEGAAESGQRIGTRYALPSGESLPM